MLRTKYMKKTMRKLSENEGVEFSEKNGKKLRFLFSWQNGSKIRPTKMRISSENEAKLKIENDHHENGHTISLPMDKKWTQEK